MKHLNFCFKLLTLIFLGLSPIWATLTFVAILLVAVQGFGKIGPEAQICFWIEAFLFFIFCFFVYLSDLAHGQIYRNAVKN